jgi:hypothetical protein
VAWYGRVSLTKKTGFEKEEAIIPDQFHFYFLEEPDYLHRAERLGVETYLITWNATEESSPDQYDVKDVQRLINNGLWVVEDDCE